jgi:hypothetical protein
MNSKEYSEYKQKVARFFAQEEIDDITYDHRHDSFSWWPCDCCKRQLGGTRYHVLGYSRTNKRLYEFSPYPIDYSVCTDCLYYSEYGELPDDLISIMETGESTEAAE